MYFQNFFPGTLFLNVGWVLNYRASKIRRNKALKTFHTVAPQSKETWDSTRHRQCWSLFIATNVLEFHAEQMDQQLLNYSGRKSIWFDWTRSYYCAGCLQGKKLMEREAYCPVRSDNLYIGTHVCFTTPNCYLSDESTRGFMPQDKCYAQSVLLSYS
jgi:hypothetical protein